MTVILNRPYKFVPPHRGNVWPSFIQTFRLVDLYLRKKEGVIGYEFRGIQHFQSAVDSGSGILLAPNHCRYADPLVLGWPARQVGVHLYAMASWHLFNKSSFDSFAIRRMGAFSVHREGSDRQSLEMAIGALATAERPLALFPEGTTNRTNDVLKPLLDGVAFIARTAARRRKKACGGNVVMLPMGLKYLCVGDVRPWADAQLRQLEDRFGWQEQQSSSILQRTIHVAHSMLSLREIEYLGQPGTGDLPLRRDALIEGLLGQAESHLQLDESGDTNPSTPDDTRTRVRLIRSEVVSRYFTESNAEEQEKLAADAKKADLAQELLSFPDCYLQGSEVTDTRVVETIQRMQELLIGKADNTVPLKVIVECDPVIEVPSSKAPRGQRDPIMIQLESQLQSMIKRLSRQANPASEVGLCDG